MNWMVLDLPATSIDVNANENTQIALVVRIEQSPS
jgi:hypothetical protein